MSSMHRRRLPDFRPTHASPAACGQIFGKLIRSCRERDGRPIEELAPSACLTPAEWVQIEAGQAPDNLEQVLLLATVLRLGDSWLAPMLGLCAGAQAK